MNSSPIEKKYYTANQVYEAYGIKRSVLGQLVLEGRVTVKRIETEVAVLNLYSVADLEKIIEGDGGEDA